MPAETTPEEKARERIAAAAASNETELDLAELGLTALPPEIAQLQNLRNLSLDGNQLTTLPPEIAQLQNLQDLRLDGNQLTSLPPEIAQLQNLERLWLAGNQLTALPPEFAQLQNLEWLSLDHNQLTSLPPEIAQLQNLRYLWLDGNQLTTLPPEIAKLQNLEHLWLDGNQLTALPPELGQMQNLEHLVLDNNNDKLASPPPELVQQGTAAILGYLRGLASPEQPPEHLWLSKLLLVGEGGVGKTSLLRRLRGEELDPAGTTTHGILIRRLAVPHPAQPGVSMQLNAWDFGGQEIYHATHQFFLTDKSLFLLLWNARLGWEQGKLYYWLDTIKALAPSSPVMLIATHTDQRDADLPLADLRKKYPQIIGHWALSNTEQRGIPELRPALAQAAASLPLMGQPWPATWLAAAEGLRNRREKFIAPAELQRTLESNHVPQDNRAVLSRWLHDLGDILYFQDDPALNDMVILKPEWVTQVISRVLESEEVIRQSGVFARFHMEQLWEDIDANLRDHFLRLMERFDLSYRTLDNREISIVVERLPLDPPNFKDHWDQRGCAADCHEISMQFNFTAAPPAGLPTWFIARSHRFTTHTHWRMGALFADDPARTHLALVQAAPHDRYIRFTVRGPSPQNFFALLRDGLELTINRFHGLDVERLIPCPGHQNQPCSHFFDFKNLQKAAERKPPVRDVQCPVAFENVSVPLLLFGIHWQTQDSEILSRLEGLQATADAHFQETRDLRQLAQREFLNAYRRDQADVDAHCPNLFTLRPLSDELLLTLSGPHGQQAWSAWWERLAGQRLKLQLLCQDPGHWHPATKGGEYTLERPAVWLQAIGPYVQRMVALLKYVSPLVGPGVELFASEAVAHLFKKQIAFTKELVDKLSELKEPSGLRFMQSELGFTEPESAKGAALRTMRRLLDELDPDQHWGGLTRTFTPEGHILWLCPEHRKPYLV